MSVRNSILSISTLAIAFFFAGSYLLNFDAEKETRYEPRKENAFSQAAQGYKGAVEYYSKLREGLTPEIEKQTREAVKNFESPKANLDMDWSQEGPVNIGGRTRAILLLKDNPSHMLVGSVSGGIWRSTDEGKNWQRVPDFDEEVIVSSMAQTGNGDIYVGTGSVHECPCIGYRGSEFYGRGLYKSSDGGQSYQLVPGTRPDTNSGSDEWVFVNDLTPDPTHTNDLMRSSLNTFAMPTSRYEQRKCSVSYWRSTR
jgi:hypothetical protein